MFGIISWNYYFYYSNTFHFLVITWADKNLPRKFSWILLAISPREKQSHAKFWLPVGNNHLPSVVNRAYFKYVNGGLIRFYPVLNLFIMSVCISIVLLVLTESFGFRRGIGINHSIYMFKLVWLMYLFARSASLQTPDDNHSYKNSFQSQEYSHYCFHNVLLDKGPA